MTSSAGLVALKCEAGRHHSVTVAASKSAKSSALTGTARLSDAPHGRECPTMFGLWSDGDRTAMIGAGPELSGAGVVDVAGDAFSGVVSVNTAHGLSGKDDL